MIPMTIEEIEALDTLLQYNWADELNDYLDHEDEHDAECHIFGRMVLLDNFIRRQRGFEEITITEHLEDE